MENHTGKFYRFYDGVYYNNRLRIIEYIIILTINIDFLYKKLLQIGLDISLTFIF